MLSLRRTVTHPLSLRGGAQGAICAILMAAFTPLVQSEPSHSDTTVQHGETQQPNKVQVRCLPDGNGYLRAKLNGAIAAELKWTNTQMECAGSVRPNGAGVRIRFKQVTPAGTPALVLLFGIGQLREGEAAKALPVNVTVMREGSGEFFSTQGDNKCTVDEVHQQLLSSAPFRKRSYRVEARGFCTAPARAVNGDGSVLITRFDFAGFAEFESEEADNDAPTVNAFTNAAGSTAGS